MLGEFIINHRLEKEIKCQKLADIVGISPAYLSQLEHGIRLNPNPEIIISLSKAFHLSSEESTILFDLYAGSSGQLPPDIAEYLKGNQMVMQCLRQARDANATEEDWKHFIEQLKK